MNQKFFLKTSTFLTNQQITLRQVNPEDDEFLYHVYASTRADEMALVDWTDEQKKAFLRMQFQAQTRHYRLQYLNAEYQIIQRYDGIPIGRLIIDRSGGSILLMDIALLPEFRSAGIGTTIMHDLMAEAASTNRPVMLHVEVFNPAMRLYKRLGFVKSSEQGIYHEMIWQPDQRQA